MNNYLHNIKSHPIAMWSSMMAGIVITGYAVFMALNGFNAHVDERVTSTVDMKLTEYSPKIVVAEAFEEVKEAIQENTAVAKKNSVAVDQLHDKILDGRIVDIDQRIKDYNYELVTITQRMNDGTETKYDMSRALEIEQEIETLRGKKTEIIMRATKSGDISR